MKPQCAPPGSPRWFRPSAAFPPLGPSEASSPRHGHLPSSDSSAALPDNYAFSADDAGSHTFADGVTFAQGGPQTLTVTDLDNPDLTATATVSVG